MAAFRRGEDVQEEAFPGRISRRLSLAIGLLFLLVLLVGGVSLLLARSIILITWDIKRQGEHIQVMDAFHSSIHHLINEVQQSVITGLAPSPARHRDLMAEPNRLLKRYRDLEEREGEFPEKEREFKVYQEIHQMTSAGRQRVFEGR